MMKENILIVNAILSYVLISNLKKPSHMIVFPYIHKYNK